MRAGAGSGYPLQGKNLLSSIRRVPLMMTLFVENINLASTGLSLTGVRTGTEFLERSSGMVSALSEWFLICLDDF